MLKSPHSFTQTSLVQSRKPSQIGLSSHHQQSTANNHEGPFRNLVYRIFGIFLCIMIFAIASDVAILHSKNKVIRSKEIEECSRKYLINRCNPADRVPVTEEFCNNLDICLSQENDAKVTDAFIQFIAQGYNEFFKNLSVSSTLALACAVFLVLWLLLIRNK